MHVRKSTTNFMFPRDLLLILLVIAAAVMPSCKTTSKTKGRLTRGGDVITNSIDMKLVYIPAGSFTMGSPSTEKDRDEDEQQHPVRISKVFYMGATEVTQAQWEAIMGGNPSRVKGDNLPVETVSWEDADEFCRKLSQKEGRKYRLPTEAEWEYACRAGSSERFCFGQSGLELSKYGWHRSNSGSSTHEAGTKKPNAFGLYDMHGNVYEWCSDSYDADYYSRSPSADPQGASTGTFRVLRGGSCYGAPRRCRSADRYGFTPNLRDYGVGFRIVLGL